MQKHFLLIYEVGEDYVEKRAPFRAVHLALAEQAAARGELVLGGALADPVDKAILLFRSNGPEVAQSFANNDPYVQNGLVKKWSVREWTTVAGCALKPSA
ncbi:MAG: YciI-like protein [Planctomycetota bacterium]|jgi:uncharacterized protein YciI|nr:YciI-like protein [Planctomycetota bacterium]